MDHAVVIHGMGGRSNQAWYPWVEAQLAERGFNVTPPNLPYPDDPHLSEWLPEVTECIGLQPERTLAVAHGLGCITLLHYVAKLPSARQLGGAVLVAGALHDTDPTVATFYCDPPHFDWLTSRFGRPPELIYAAGDTAAPLCQGKQLAGELEGKLTILSCMDMLQQPELPAIMRAVDRLCS